MRNTKRLPAWPALLMFFPAHLAAHGGGLDANGCHHDRKNGGYHCHRSPSYVTPESTVPSTSLTRSTIAPAPTSARSGLWTTDRPLANCAELRSAGAAPVRRGNPGYGSHLDRDNDGIGCE